MEIAQKITIHEEKTKEFSRLAKKIETLDEKKVKAIMW